MTKIPPDDILEGLYKLRTRESGKTQDRIGIVRPGDSSEASSRKFEMRILGTELEILRRTPWSRIREQNSVYKEFLEIVGREPEVPEEGAPEEGVSMALRGLPQMNLQQLILWKNGIRFMNSRRKGPKRMMTKVQWLC